MRKSSSASDKILVTIALGWAGWVSITLISVVSKLDVVASKIDSHQVNLSKVSPSLLSPEETKLTPSFAYPGLPIKWLLEIFKAKELPDVKK